MTKQTRLHSSISHLSLTGTPEHGRTAAHSPEDDRVMRASYLRVRDQREALPADALAPINTDPLGSVGIVLEAMPGIRAMRARMAKLPEFDIADVDQLEDYANGMWFAELNYVAAITPTESLPELNDQVTHARDDLFLAAQALAARKLLSSAALDELRKGGGYRETANDVLTLVTMFRDHWAAISTHTAVTEDEITAAATLARKLTIAVFHRDNPTSNASDASLDRQRAYTLFVRAYNRVRRAVAYLSGEHGDPEQVAPTLFVRGPRSSGNAKSNDPAPREPAAPTAPTAPTASTTPHGAVPASLRGDTNVPQDDPFGRT